MSAERFENQMSELVEIVNKIAMGRVSAVDRLMELTVPGNTSPIMAELAEAVGSIVVQNEGREFRLEMIIQDLLHAQAKLEEAKHDPLTGLPNRAMFHDILREKLDSAKTDESLVGLMFIDLDKFKQVNDTMGHDAGDELLVQVADRLNHCVECDGIVARIGGDEFTAILSDVPNMDVATQMAQTMISELNRPFGLEAGPANIGGSIGLAFYPTDAQCAISLLKNADIAMYKAKDSGRNNCQCFCKMHL